MSHDRLKTLLGAPEFQGLSDAEILAKLNAKDQVEGEKLTRAELMIFFANNPDVELKLIEIRDSKPALTNPSQVAIWGLANTALRLADQSGVEFATYENLAVPLLALKSAGILSDAQYQGLVDLSTTKASRAYQLFERDANQADLDFARQL